MRLWVLALVITLAAGVYQRLTGPTYPVRGKVTIGGQSVKYRLTRSHGGKGDQLISIRVPDPAVSGEISWKRYPTDEPFTIRPMRRDGDQLVAVVPHQPPAGKVEYRIQLDDAGRKVSLPPRGNVITRFKGAVPIWILAPHIFLMFFADALLESRRSRGAAQEAAAARLRPHDHGAS